jgi:hypothetical protein
MSLIDHIRKVNQTPAKPVLMGGAAERPLPKGPFVYEYEEDDGTITEIEYTFDERVLRKGGDERKDYDGNVYFIELDLLPEFEFHDETIDTDKEFWDWMNEFIRTYDLKPIRRQKQRTLVKASDWGFGQYQSASKYLSDRWKGTNYFADVGGDVARKLAVALQAIQTTVRVVDTHERRMRVKLANAEDNPQESNFIPTSATNFTDNEIWVSACALVDSAIEEGDAVDITTGFALHEASHAQYTIDILHALDQPNRLEPLAVASLLFNIMEDMRIERNTSQVFPGFEGYFDKALDYMWESFASKRSPKRWGPELTDKLNAIIQMLKWPEHYRPIYEANADLKAEAEWWQDWNQRYLDEKMSARAALVEAIKHLDDDDKKQMDEQRAKEKQAQIEQDKLNEAIQKAIDQLDPNQKLMKPCSSVTSAFGHDKKLDTKRSQLSSDTAKQSERLAEERIKVERDIKEQFPNGPGRPDAIVSQRPLEDDYSRQSYRNPDMGLVQRMKHAFHLRPSAMEWTDRLRKSGSVDEDEIWRAGAGDLRFFEQRTVESAPDTSIAILVDVSGSMNGYRMESAVNACSILHHCLKDMNGVNVHVYGHTAGVGERGSATIYRIWAKGEPLSRLGLLHTVPGGNNYDGYALAWVVKDLMRQAKPDEQRLVFIISDGLPNGSSSQGHYGGADAMQHIREVGRWAERQGVDIVQIAVGGVSPQQQAVMYKHWVPFDGNATKLPSQIMGILRKVM